MIQEGNTIRSTPRKRTRYTPEEKAALVADYGAWAGGLKAFCETRGISAASLSAWRRRGFSSSVSEAKAGGWVEVAMSPGKPAAREIGGGLWVEFRHGPVAAARIPAGTDPKWTARVVEALRCGG